MRKFAALVLILLAAACTPIVQADVTRFSTPDLAPPRSFTILPEGDQAGSLEFQRYAELVADGLAGQGWRPVAPGGAADAIVHLRWGSEMPNTVYWESPTSVYSGMGWGSRSRWYGAGAGWDPFPYTEVRSATYYPLWLRVEMLDSAALRGGTKKVLFEGRAVAERSRRDIAPVMPYLVTALFRGFPGTNGTTVRVEVPINR